MAIELLKPIITPKMIFHDLFHEECENCADISCRTPVVDWSFDEKSNIFDIMVEMPGVKKENLEIKSTEKTITISTKKDSNPNFYRNFEFIDLIKHKEVKAKLEDGILTLKIEKFIPEDKKPVEINIE